MSAGFAWWLRLMLVGAGLGLLWMQWRPVTHAWPEDLARPTDDEELRRVPAGRAFLLSGRVEPLPGAPVRAWEGRFVFRHRQRQDQSGRSGKTVSVVTVAEHRPALRWVWAGGTWVLPADSYGLENAPRIEPRFWPRKWLWTTRVDDWDRSSRGFRPEEAALALGEIRPDGRPLITALVSADEAAVVADLGRQNRARWWLTVAAKTGLTVLALALCLGRRRVSRGGP